MPGGERLEGIKNIYCNYGIDNYINVVSIWLRWMWCSCKTSRSSFFRGEMLSNVCKRRIWFYVLFFRSSQEKRQRA